MAMKKKKGFAGMPKNKVRMIAALGGRAAHAQGKGHIFTSEEAKIAGSIGGKRRHAKH